MTTGTEQAFAVDQMQAVVRRRWECECSWGVEPYWCDDCESDATETQHEIREDIDDGACPCGATVIGDCLFCGCAAVCVCPAVSMIVSNPRD